MILPNKTELLFLAFLSFTILPGCASPRLCLPCNNMCSQQHHACNAQCSTQTQPDGPILLGFSDGTSGFDIRSNANELPAGTMPPEPIPLARQTPTVAVVDSYVEEKIENLSRTDEVLQEQLVNMDELLEAQRQDRKQLASLMQNLTQAVVDIRSDVENQKTSIANVGQQIESQHQSNEAILGDVEQQLTDFAIRVWQRERITWLVNECVTHRSSSYSAETNKCCVFPHFELINAQPTCGRAERARKLNVIRRLDPSGMSKTLGNK